MWPSVDICCVTASMIAGMAVAQDVDRDAAEQVQVGLAVDVGDHGAVAAGQRHRRGAVVVHHHGFPPLPHVGRLACLVIALTTFVPGARPR